MRGSKNSEKHGQGFGNIDQIYYGSDQYHPVNIIDLPAVSRKESVHPSQKFIDILVYLIETYTKIDDIVLDYCMGSGSCGVAAQMLNRNFIRIEKDEIFFNIATERINNP